MPAGIGPKLYRSWPGVAGVTVAPSADEVRSSCSSGKCPGCGRRMSTDEWMAFRKQARQAGLI